MNRSRTRSAARRGGAAEGGSDPPPPRPPSRARPRARLTDADAEEKVLPPGPGRASAGERAVRVPRGDKKGRARSSRARLASPRPAVGPSAGPLRPGSVPGSAGETRQRPLGSCSPSCSGTPAGPDGRRVAARAFVSSCAPGRGTRNANPQRQPSASARSLARRLVACRRASEQRSAAAASSSSSHARSSLLPPWGDPPPGLLNRPTDEACKTKALQRAFFFFFASAQKDAPLEKPGSKS